MFSNIIVQYRRLRCCLQHIKTVYRRGGYVSYQLASIHRSELLKGKSILITGGSSGIGRCLAKRCVEEGANVVITGRNQEKLKQTLCEIGSNSLHSVAWDVGNTGILQQKLEEAIGLLNGKLHMLINNAGVLLGENFPNVTEKMWDATYQVNSKGLFFLTQAVCTRWLSEERMELRKILNISSQGAYVGATYPYRMTKWDVAGLTQGLGLKLAEHRILVNGLAPGVIATEMQPDCVEHNDNLFYSDNPIKRFALPEEIAELAVFMLSDAANFFVGQTIVCDGGFSIK
jgi:3-oxoacyl-[acyl-carrier protein] reductase